MSKINELDNFSLNDLIQLLINLEKNTYFLGSFFQIFFPHF